jgi:hypothetical protein
LSNPFILLADVSSRDVQLALAALADALRDTFFGGYPLDFEILDSLPSGFSFDWYGLMRDTIAPALLIAPRLESTFISRRCEELLRAYQDASSLVYQHELEIHELRRHLEAARLHYLQRLSSCATLRSMGVSGGPARLLVQELEDHRLSVEGFSRHLAGRLPELQIHSSARDSAFAQFLDFEAASEEDRHSLQTHLETISTVLLELESRFLGP